MLSLDLTRVHRFIIGQYTSVLCLYRLEKSTYELGRDFNCYWICYPRLFRHAVRFRVLHTIDLDFAKLHQEHSFICPAFLLITYFDTVSFWLPYHILILHVSVILHTMYNYNTVVSAPCNGKSSYLCIEQW